METSQAYAPQAALATNSATFRLSILTPCTPSTSFGVPAGNGNAFHLGKHISWPHVDIPFAMLACQATAATRRHSLTLLERRTQAVHVYVERREAPTSEAGKNTRLGSCCGLCRLYHRAVWVGLRFRDDAAFKSRKPTRFRRHQMQISRGLDEAALPKLFEFRVEHSDLARF
mmetsp:Transcript_2487/g.4212  ORF Transcript_2487/g.4212 Transcript_2487/m.4212 type:complete len:172 (-) Transcript_2487:112-627(-)